MRKGDALDSPPHLRSEIAPVSHTTWTTNPLSASSARPGHSVIEGQDKILLCSNDYLGLACDPRVTAAAIEALSRYGFGGRAARSLGGDTDAHRALEGALARFKGTAAALTFGSGFSCNVALLSALAGEGDYIFSDERNHASIVDGCRLSAARVNVYRHLDMAHLAECLEAAPVTARKLIVTDGVFSMEGEIAPLPEIVDLAGRYGATVILDEAHATGVLGPGGRGTLAHFGLEGGVVILMGTLGKALGSVGGYVASSRDLIDHLAGSARSFLFTTALPPAVAAAALQALQILQAEPQHHDRLWENARFLHRQLLKLGFTLSTEPAPILPLYFTDTSAATTASRLLFDRGVVVHAIGPPYVPPGTSRLRVIASAAYDDSDLETILAAFTDVAAALPAEVRASRVSTTSARTSAT